MLSSCLFLSVNIPRIVQSSSGLLLVAISVMRWECEWGVWGQGRKAVGKFQKLVFHTTTFSSPPDMHVRMNLCIR